MGVSFILHLVYVALHVVIQSLVVVSKLIKFHKKSLLLFSMSHDQNSIKHLRKRSLYAILAIILFAIFWLGPLICFFIQSSENMLLKLDAGLSNYIHATLAFSNYLFSVKVYCLQNIAMSGYKPRNALQQSGTSNSIVYSSSEYSGRKASVESEEV